MFYSMLAVWTSTAVMFVLAVSPLARSVVRFVLSPFTYVLGRVFTSSIIKPVPIGTEIRYNGGTVKVGYNSRGELEQYPQVHLRDYFGGIAVMMHEFLNLFSPAQRLWTRALCYTGLGFAISVSIRSFGLSLTQRFDDTFPVIVSNLWVAVPVAAAVAVLYTAVCLWFAYLASESADVDYLSAKAARNA